MTPRGARRPALSPVGLLLLAACGRSTPPAHPNVLLVSMDTVRYDHTSLGGAQDTTPNLAHLASLGVSYPNAFSPGNESLYSHAALFTGRYPSEVAVPDYGSFALPKDVPTIASVLTAYGYDTAAFTGGGHVVNAFGFDHGFATFTASPGVGHFGSFFDSVPLATAWIAERRDDTPWFLFVHGYDAHSPYIQRGAFRHWFGTTGQTDRIETIAASADATEQIRGSIWFPDRTPEDFAHASGQRILGTSFYTLPAAPRPGERAVTLTDSEIDHLRSHYDTGLAYGDLWLGLLLAHVDLDTTLVIVVSDHGEDLLDHGYMNHRAGLWDSTTHVPLVVAGPGFRGGEQRTELVDLRDVLPTILTTTGATLPAGVSGLPLQGRPDRSVLLSEGVMDMVSLRTPHARLVLREAHLASPGSLDDLSLRALDDGRASLYDLDADRHERVDLLAAPTAAALAQASALRDALTNARRALNEAQLTGAPVPEALLHALRSQGYWAPGTEVPPEGPR